eukprot:2086922-Pyramimonas_sp.AAC.1
MKAAAAVRTASASKMRPHPLVATPRPPSAHRSQDAHGHPQDVIQEGYLPAAIFFRTAMDHPDGDINQ